MSNRIYLGLIALVMLVGGAGALILGNMTISAELAVVPLLVAVILAYAIIAVQQTR